MELGAGPRSGGRARGEARKFCPSPGRGQSVGGKPAGEPQPWLKLAVLGRGDPILTRQGWGAGHGAWPEGRPPPGGRGQSGGWRAGGGAGVDPREECPASAWGRGQAQDAPGGGARKFVPTRGGPRCSPSGWAGASSPRAAGGPRSFVRVGAGRLFTAEVGSCPRSLASGHRACSGHLGGGAGGSGTFRGSVGTGLGHPEGGMGLECSQGVEAARGSIF